MTGAADLLIVYGDLAFEHLARARVLEMDCAGPQIRQVR